MATPTGKRPKSLLVDPSRFTAPYDGELAKGLASIGVEVQCATRPLRPGEADEFAPGVAVALFYRHADRLASLPFSVGKALKGLSHLVGLLRLGLFILRENFTVVHFQWAVFPIVDALFMLILRLRVPVVMTVHDAVPFNGERISFLQSLGFDLPIRAADCVIVHTLSAREMLIKRGHPAAKVHVIPHGPLPLKGSPVRSRRREADEPWAFTLFGQLKPYKGLDVLLDAIVLCRTELEGRARFVIAGAAHMDMAPALSQIAAEKLENLVDLRLGRLSDDEMAKLFGETDCFLFPYRQIDASGVFFLTKPLRKWMIASRVGIFAEGLSDGVDATLVTPGVAKSLAEAIVAAVNARPAPAIDHHDPDWADIARLTVEHY